MQYAVNPSETFDMSYQDGKLCYVVRFIIITRKRGIAQRDGRPSLSHRRRTFVTRKNLVTVATGVG